jgi:hypothetical protein
MQLQISICGSDSRITEILGSKYRSLHILVHHKAHAGSHPDIEPAIPQKRDAGLKAMASADQSGL